MRGDAGGGVAFVVKKTRLSKFKRRKDEGLPRRLRMSLAKARRRHPRWCLQFLQLHQAIATVEEFLEWFKEDPTEILDPERILKGSR